MWCWTSISFCLESTLMLLNSHFCCFNYGFWWANSRMLFGQSRIAPPLKHQTYQSYPAKKRQCHHKPLVIGNSLFLGLPHLFWRFYTHINDGWTPKKHHPPGVPARAVLFVDSGQRPRQHRRREQNNAAQFKVHHVGTTSGRGFNIDYQTHNDGYPRWTPVLLYGISWKISIWGDNECVYIYTYMENQPSWYWIVRIQFYYTYVLFE